MKTKNGVEMNVLVIAPHPDDEVLGCGGTIAKHTYSGDKVHLCIVTKAYTPDWSEEYISRKSQEIMAASEILGIRHTSFLDIPTVKLDIFPQKDLNDGLYRAVSETKPDIVYIPHGGDLNKDHRLVFESSLVALRPLSHKVKKIMSYEVPSETEWGQPIKPFFPTVYVDISSTFSSKINAMKEYRSELKEFPHPRSLEGIEALAKKRGSEITTKYAEAFQLIREVS
jgi:LmbE family N-acetylglucosaminyl deacetylase